MPVFLHGQVSHHYAVYRASDDSADWIVFIHGAGLDLTSWDTLIPYFRGSYHLLCYDLRGHGETGLGNDPLDWKLYVTDMIALTEYLGVSRFHVVAHGIGSLIAVQTGILFGSKVNTLTLTSIPIFLSNELAQKIALHRERLIRGGEMDAVADYLLGQITLQHPDSPVARRLRQTIAKTNAILYLDTLEVFLKVHSKIYDNFKLLRKPVLIITGDSDPLYPSYLTQLITTRIADSRTITISQSSNMVFVDQPVHTANQIEAFYRERMELCSANQAAKTENDPFYQELHSELREWASGSRREKSRPLLKVQLMDSFQVLIDGKEVIEGWNRRGAQKLLVFLLLHRHATRTQICEQLWGGNELARSRGRLRVYLSHLRKLLQVGDESPFLKQDRERIYLTGEIECDLLAYMQLIHFADKEKDEAVKSRLAAEALADVPSGLLSDYYDDWILEVRERLERQITELAEWMVDWCERKGAYAEAARYVSLMNRFDPDEPRLYDKAEQLLLKANKQKEAAGWRRRKKNISPE